jgi:hypothetical protein
MKLPIESLESRQLLSSAGGVTAQYQGLSLSVNPTAPVFQGVGGNENSGAFTRKRHSTNRASSSVSFASSGTPRAPRQSSTTDISGTTPAARQGSTLDISGTMPASRQGNTPDISGTTPTAHQGGTLDISGTTATSRQGSTLDISGTTPTSHRGNTPDISGTTSAGTIGAPDISGSNLTNGSSRSTTGLNAFGTFSSSSFVSLFGGSVVFFF